MLVDIEWIFYIRNQLSPLYVLFLSLSDSKFFEELTYIMLSFIRNNRMEHVPIP